VERCIILLSWRDIPGYEGLYTVSSYGEIWSLRKNKVLKAFLAGSTVPHFQVQLVDKDGNKKHWYVHQLVALAFIGPRKPGEETRHKDGNELRNCADNLEYGTKGDNQRDSVAHGTHNNARKKECKNKHKYTKKNTYTFPDGRRACKTCMQASRERYLAKKLVSLEHGPARPLRRDRAPSA